MNLVSLKERSAHEEVGRRVEPGQPAELAAFRSLRFSWRYRYALRLATTLEKWAR